MDMGLGSRESSFQGKALPSGIASQSRFDLCLCLCLDGLCRVAKGGYLRLLSRCGVWHAVWDNMGGGGGMLKPDYCRRTGRSSTSTSMAQRHRAWAAMLLAASRRSAYELVCSPSNGLTSLALSGTVFPTERHVFHPWPASGQARWSSVDPARTKRRPWGLPSMR